MVPVKDIRSGRTGSRPAHFSKLNNTAYFTAHTEIEGRELWCSNGTNSRFFSKESFGNIGEAWKTCDLAGRL
jgi:hypothetical protein